MWTQVVDAVREMRRETQYVAYHHPEQELDAPSHTGTVRFVPHPRVPLGQVWVVHNRPSGRIVLED